MIVYLVLWDQPKNDRLLFCKTTKDLIGRWLPMVGLLTEAQMEKIGGMLLTMAKNDKIILYRKVDQSLEFLSVTKQSEVGHLINNEFDRRFIAAEIDRETDFTVRDYWHKGETYFRTDFSAEFVPAAIHDEVHDNRYALWWNHKVGPMPINTQLYARKSDVAKLSGNNLEQAGFRVQDVDDRTGTVLMTVAKDGDPKSH